MKILTVANHKAMLDALEEELRDIFPGSEIVKETDALMAGKYAFNQGVDIVFAEAEMKRMNGLQLIRFVRQEHPRVRSYLMGSQEELSESFVVVSEDITGILVYPFAHRAVQDTCKRSEC